MEILTPDKINQPRGTLIFEAPKEEDWHLELGASLPDVNPSGDWRASVTEHVLQRNDNFDGWDCVTNALVSKVECIINYAYTTITQWSRRYIAVLSGTRPKVGNSVNNPCEYLRKSGAVKEEDYVTITPTMTEAEFFQPISDNVKSKECFLNNWSYSHQYLTRQSFNSPTCSIQTLKAGLKQSPIMVSIEGKYNFDGRGRVIWGGGDYVHEVLIVHIDNDTAYILDSENPSGFIPFDVNYPFAYPKIGYINKLTNITPKDFEFMKLEPIRNVSNGKIYIVNTSNKKCWFKTQADFIQLMGQTAWDEKQWTDVPTTQIDPLEDGVTIDFSRPSLIDALKALISQFGAKGHSTK